MPVCSINGCTFVPGRHCNGYEIKLHCFPNSLQRIKEWLLQLGQHFHDIDAIANQILDNKRKKYNKYRLCSLHFSDDSFIINADGRTLRPNALPTIFHGLAPSSEKMNEDLSLRKAFKRKRENKTPDENSPLCGVPSQSPSSDVTPQSVESIKVEVLDNFPLSAESTIGNCSIANQIGKTESYRDAQTQTEFTFKNSIIYLLDNDFLTGNTVFDPCGPPYLSLQNPVVALNCFLPAPGNLS
ncbi:uncharacterized protein LOC120988585 [Bufo bufo]|uniref:uncharacterized protein LOC120988585 n=1 Tax=Bufo bufo TaxID=8384 RepID=UPI001ABE88EC|nr:uncharacterized protein LOC120988585 [Bufo bufo]